MGGLLFLCCVCLCVENIRSWCVHARVIVNVIPVLFSLSNSLELCFALAVAFHCDMTSSLAHILFACIALVIFHAFFLIWFVYYTLWRMGVI
jgi:hypothetical protein